MSINKNCYVNTTFGCCLNHNPSSVSQDCVTSGSSSNPCFSAEPLLPESFAILRSSSKRLYRHAGKDNSRRRDSRIFRGCCSGAEKVHERVRRWHFRVIPLPSRALNGSAFFLSSMPTKQVSELVIHYVITIVILMLKWSANVIFQEHFLRWIGFWLPVHCAINPNT